MDYACPEVGVTSAAGACFGRNYFGRYSAPETEDDDFADERVEVLAEAAALKALAVDYLHPEVGVIVADAALFGRNYFHRASAPEAETSDDANERALVMAEAAALKKSAVDHMCPEVGVTSASGACFGRNYFSRHSAPESEEDDLANERAAILADAVALKNHASPEESQDVATVMNLAAAVKGANLPGTKSTKLNSFDQDVGGTKKSSSTVNLFGLSEGLF